MSFCHFMLDVHPLLLQLFFLLRHFCFTRLLLSGSIIPWIRHPLKVTAGKHFSPKVVLKSRCYTQTIIKEPCTLPGDTKQQ